MAKSWGIRARRVAGALALAGFATAPARAQFMTGAYPVLIVPPPAQSLVIPKPPKPRQTQPPEPSAPQPDTGGDQSRCYQGRAKIC